MRIINILLTTTIAWLLIAESSPVNYLESREPFDYSSTFNREPEPEPTPVEDVEPDPLPPEIEEEWQPIEQVEEEPPQQVERFKRKERIAYNTDDAPQMVILSECGVNETDRRGNYNSRCTYCNMAVAAAKELEHLTEGGYRVGEEEWCDIRVLDIDTDLGREVDLEMGANGRPLTEIVGKQETGKYQRVTPVIVVRFPDRDPTVVAGWKGGEPLEVDAAWYLTGLMGKGRDNPQTWGLVLDEGYDPLGAALAMWVQDGDTPRAQSWGVTIPAGELINYAFTDGKREIARGVTLVVPADFRPYWDVSGGQPRIMFQNPPYITYKIAFIPRKKSLSHIEFSRDFSKMTIHAKGYRTSFPVNIDWSRDSSP